MTQEPLDFENREPLARANDPATSHEAAVELTGSGARGRQKDIVLMRLRRMRTMLNAPPPTSAEFAWIHGLDRYMVARRLPDLERDGFVEKGQSRRCTRTGRRAMTWVVV